MSDSVIEIASLVNASDVNTTLVNASDVNTSDVNVIDVNTTLVNTSDANTNAVQIVTPENRAVRLYSKISIIPTVAFELYRVFISSFLILFVPQKCEDHVCQLHENLVFETAKYGAGVVFNLLQCRVSCLIFY